MLYPGDRVKDYEVIAPLRSGGMAMLYLARRRGVGGFSRLVALKLVHSHLLRDQAMTRLFLEEARISANIAHPNVVSVEEIGQTGGNYFIAMEYVHGISLAELLSSLREKRMRMSPKLCVWLTAQIAEALHAVHEATGENGAPLQIVHRDVSPQNVLVGHTGHVKLIDFGIAKSQARQTGNDLSVLGKLGYMAPEQLRSEPADRRTDVYALGVMLWEMIAARSLYRCRSVDDERDWAAREKPLPPGRFTTCSTPAIDRVVVKALACAREQRHATAIDFRTALLHAEPSAAQIDAPMFAAMMRTMLGNKLERLREKLPSEVSLQLARDVEVTTARARSVEGLTAEMGSSDDVIGALERGALERASEERPAPIPEEPDFPSLPSTTLADIAAQQALPSVQAALTAALDQDQMPEAETGPTRLFTSEPARAPTEPAPTYLVESPRPLPPAAQVWLLRATLGLVCLAIGIGAGALVSGFGPRSKPALASSAPALATADVAQLPAPPRPAPATLAADAGLVPPVAARAPETQPARMEDATPPSARRPSAGPTLKRGAPAKAGPTRALKLAKAGAAPAKGNAAGRKAKNAAGRKTKSAPR